jgi:DNA modification methylase
VPALSPDRRVTVRVLDGDCREVLASLPAESVQTCVTSPPYFGLRDYGVAGQIGLEATPDAFVTELVAVFREVRRVLRDDGTLWLNLGDSYNSAPVGSFNGGGFKDSSARSGGRDLSGVETSGRMSKLAASGLPAKNLLGIPWRVAFALQADGWYLRSDIIWHKPNPMPESVTDRPTKSHEYLFLLSKSPTYFYDSDAIAEPLTESSIERLSQPTLDEQEGSYRVPGKTNGPMKAVGKLTHRSTLDGGGHSSPQLSGRGDRDRPDGKRNKRTVWTVATQPYSGAHFATFPPALIEPCILAGSARGDTVLDPFGGAGTTGLVADRLGRDAILCELNPTYAEMARRRITDDAPLFGDVA